MPKFMIDEGLIVALAAGATAAAAAQRCGVSEKTVRRRLADPNFRAKVSAQRSELIAAAVGRLATMGNAAADELYRLVKEGENDQVKLGACRAILGYMMSGHEHETVVRQLDELRRRVEEGERNGNGSREERDSTDPGAAGQPEGETDLAGGPAAPGSERDPETGGGPTGLLASGITPLFG
jgi:hypothetical protein